MRTTIREALLRCVLLTALLLPVLADADGGHGRGGRRPRAVPEFDMAAVGAIGALLAGGGYLLARRRK